MRRTFLSVVLCVCMMLTMAPFAFAEGDSTTELNISSGGGGYETSLPEAINETITLTKDTALTI